MPDIETETHTHTALSPVKCDGKRRGVNAGLSLTDEEAEELLLLGIVREGPPDRDPEDETADDEGADADIDVAALVAAAFADLTEGDFTGAEPKRPKVRAVERILKGKVDPRAITPELVGEAWEAHAATETDETD